MGHSALGLVTSLWSSGAEISNVAISNPINKYSSVVSYITSIP